MRFNLYVLLMLLAQAAAGQSAFFFNPESAVPEGGAEIQLFAAGTLRFTAPQVFFGGIPSPQVTVVNASTIIAVAPAHGVAVVSVTVIDNGVILASDENFAFEPLLEEILIPIAYQPIDASHGTRWVSEISVYNDSDDTVAIDREICFFIGSPVDCSQNVRRVPPHSSMAIQPGSIYTQEPAMLLTPPADHAGRLHFNVRLHETSRDPDGAGTEIPVVRSRDFQQKQVWLPSVPANGRFRTTVRVYTRGMTITVRVKDNETGELLSEREIVRDHLPTDVDPFGTVQLNDPLTPAQMLVHKTVRFEIGSDNPVWALVTLTENDTQRVQIFTPQ